MAALIEARGLHAYYDSSHVLRGVDFHVAAAEAVGLFGRNGMGKTTLLRTLLGHLTPRRGVVNIRGVEVTGQPPEKIARLVEILDHNHGYRLYQSVSRL